MHIRLTRAIRPVNGRVVDDEDVYRRQLDGGLGDVQQRLLVQTLDERLGALGARVPTWW